MVLHITVVRADNKIDFREQSLRKNYIYNILNRKFNLVQKFIVLVVRVDAAILNTDGKKVRRENNDIRVKDAVKHLATDLLCSRIDRKNVLL